MVDQDRVCRTCEVWDHYKPGAKFGCCRELGYVQLECRPESSDLRTFTEAEFGCIRWEAREASSE